MKSSSSSLTIRLARHLCTSTAAAASPTTITISKAKHKLRSEYDPDKALEIYSSMSDEKASPVASRYAQDLTIQRLAKSHRFTDIEALIESHKNDPKIKQEPFLSTLIRSYAKAGMFDHALKTYNQMDDLGTPRSTVSFNALLAACNSCRKYDDVPQLFEDLPKKHGFVPDKVSYGILIRSYCEKGNPEMGLEKLGEMEEKGVEVTAVTFTTILNALYRKGKTDEAERVWGVMVEKGCEPDVAAFNVRLSHLQGGEPEGVKMAIEEMSAAGLKPDMISYNYLITSYCRNMRMKEAIKQYEELEASGFKLKAATFRTLIHYLCKYEDYATGYDVFKKSVKHHKIPDFATLKTLVEGLVAKKMRRDAKGLIRTVKKKFPPNVTVAWKKVEEELGLSSEDSFDKLQADESEGKELRQQRSVP